MHPDLAALRSRYDELFAAAKDKLITAEDAALSLATLSVTDDDGAVWTIDVHGNFHRAPHPGAAATPADPAQYGNRAAPTAPTPAPTPAPASTAPGTDHGLTPPAFVTTNQHIASHVTAAPQFAPAPHQQAPEATWAPATSPTLATGVFAGPSTPDPPRRTLFRPTADRTARSLYADNRSAGSRALTTVRTLLRRYGLLLAAALTIIAMLAIHAHHPAGSDLPAAPQPTPTPTAAAGTPTPSAAPSTGGPERATALPSAEDVRRAVAALRSGDRTRVATLVDQHDPARTAVAAALFAGLHAAGLTLSSPTPTEHDGTVTADWVLNGPGTQPITITTTWVRVAGAWKLATAPTP